MNDGEQRLTSSKKGTIKTSHNFQAIFQVPLSRCVQKSLKLKLKMLWKSCLTLMVTIHLYCMEKSSLDVLLPITYFLFEQRLK